MLRVNDRKKIAFVRVIIISCIFLLCVFHSLNSIAQATYTMENAFVEDCEGILTDSENGPEEGQYDHNEDYTFTICVDNADEIIIAFNFFSSEETYDILTIHDGPDVSAPVLATLTGSIQPPPVFVAVSGCVTFHFTSDANIVAAGWELEWMVEIDEPTPPVLYVISVLDCPMDAITYQFDIPVECDMLNAGNFTLIGPGNPSIAQINPLDCTPGGLGQLFEVEFTSPLSRPGTYRLLFNGAIQDACGEWHDVSANVVFELMNCPFEVVINLVNDACQGDCGNVHAEVIGDAGVSYNYMWSHTLQNQETVDVCTDISVLISVTVTDPISMEMATAQYNYIPLENPAILNPIQDTVCSSRGDHFYQSTIPGGLYTSSIIPANLQMEGRYQFWRWGNMNNLNIDIVTYEAPNGCTAYDTVYVLPVNAGSIEAACLNSADFTVSGGTPTGGIWQGPYITTAGVFSPVQAGSFVINYTAPNGCIGYKRVNVEDNIIMPNVDTLCSSQEFDLVAMPNGGRWTGPGIINQILGRIRCWTVAPNQSYTYIYTLHGCSDTMSIYIQEIWAGPDIAMCAEDSLLILSQTGDWSGPGIYFPGQNTFDVSMLGPGEYDYTLTALGCTDITRLYILQPYADPYEPLSFCQDDEWIPLNDILEFSPDWGTFTGPAIVENNDEWFFNPAFAGGGQHTIVFEALGCTDSFVIDVEPYAEIPEYSFCELSPAEILSADPPGGIWSGAGFLDAQSGLFDPQLLLPGSYPISYETPKGCITLDTIDIILWEQVSISGVSQQYCNVDTFIQVVIAPPGGSFFIDGIPSPSSFNPQLLGTGTHELYYTRGTGPCASNKRIFFSVLLPITGMTTPADSICSGENAMIAIDASGGSGTLTATWDQGLGFGSSHIVNPLQNTTYTVTITDGCSDPFIGSANVFVHQPFNINVLTGPPVCYDDTSYVEIVTPDPDEYVVYWHTDSIFENPRLEGKPGIYAVDVFEIFSGCLQSYDIQIPGPPPLSANFTIIPNQPCIDIIDNTIQIIDLATGYTEGWIDFGDGTDPIAYISGELIEHDYNDIGEFTITLVLSNDLGCMDTLTRQLCVENRVVMFIPSAFSPNGDGNNDELKFDVFGVSDFHCTIFTRWGEKIFEGNTIDSVWDGKFNNQPLDPGVFVLQVRYKDQVTGEPGERISTLTLIR